MIRIISKELRGSRSTLDSKVATFLRPSRFNSSRSNKLSNHAEPEVQQHVFQPVASLSSASPMRRQIPWLDAYRAREAKQKDWAEKHPGVPEPASGLSYSYTDIKTRAVVDKSPDKSFTYAVLPFRDDKWFMDAYINASGRLRIGQIFQDLDALAGVISYEHCSPAEPVLVTASVDRIFMLKRLDDISSCNVSLSGNVTWTGRSSLEITIQAATHAHDLPETLTNDDVKAGEVFLTANFTFVARDPETNKSFPINHLVPVTEQDKVAFVRAEKYNKHKKEVAKNSSLEIAPPSEEESKLIHDLWIKSKQYALNPTLKPQNMVYTHDTKINSTAVMQPQYRNRHSYMIFGGYLLRQTFELAYACSAAFSHESPRFVSLDSTTFKNPVPVGSVLYLDATVSYVEPAVQKNVKGSLVQVRVETLINDLKHGVTKETGVFTYSFFVEGVHQVLPQSYSEMMEYVEGRRAARETKNFNMVDNEPETIVSE